MGYLSTTLIVCDCETALLFFQRGEAGEIAATGFRKVGVIAFFVEDAEQVECPNCGRTHNAPIPETLDLDRSTFGRMLMEMGKGQGQGDEDMT